MHNTKLRSIARNPCDTLSTSVYPEFLQMKLTLSREYRRRMRSRVVTSRSGAFVCARHMTPEPLRCADGSSSSHCKDRTQLSKKVWSRPGPSLILQGAKPKTHQQKGSQAKRQKLGRHFARFLFSTFRACQSLPFLRTARCRDELRERKSEENVYQVAARRFKTWPG